MDAEDSENLFEQQGMLVSQADLNPERPTRAQFGNDRGELDRFRPSPEDEEAA
jgi:hypothetical protein